MDYTRISTTAERLREAMNAAGMRQADLVRATGLNKGMVSRYVSGELEPKQNAIHKLSVALGVSEMWLWGYDVPAYRTDDQKKNDQLSALVVKMRENEQFYNTVVLLSEADEAQLALIDKLLLGLLHK